MIVKAKVEFVREHVRYEDGVYQGYAIQVGREARLGFVWKMCGSWQWGVWRDGVWYQVGLGNDVTKEDAAKAMLKSYGWDEVKVIK